MTEPAPLKATTPADSHLSWFAIRQHLLAAYEKSHDIDPNGSKTIHSLISEQERLIMETPATSRDGLLGKALLCTDFHIGPDGTDFASRVIENAVALGMIEAAA